ncbi:MAG: hypothetical protein LC672_05205, partial [Acidobacteria bacterium]|nr:hypothetical protein [Acidobacteriota bacterium]
GEQSARVDAESGHLVLAPGGAQSTDKLTAAVLGQRAVSGDYVATTLVETRAMAAGAHAGLAAYSWRWGAVGVSVGSGRVFAWRREGKDEKTHATADASGATSVYLRMTAKGGEHFSFAYSTNGRDWRELGGAVQGSHVEGAHVALTAGGAGARFGWLRITPARPAKRD